MKQHGLHCCPIVSMAQAPALPVSTLFPVLRWGEGEEGVVSGLCAPAVLGTQLQQGKWPPGSSCPTHGADPSSIHHVPLEPSPGNWPEPKLPGLGCRGQRVHAWQEASSNMGTLLFGVMQ